MKKTFYLFLLLVFCCKQVQAQTTEDDCGCNQKKDTIGVMLSNLSLLQSEEYYGPTLPKIIPPSPSSRILQKFLGYPISYATGTINIDIPLYNMEIYGANIPLDIKYHSSGIKTQDPVGPIGRGWGLFPGFKISRTVMGKPDEIFPVTQKLHMHTIEETIYMAPPSTTTDCVIDGRYIHDQRIDGQYDIFQVHMPGIESSFILKNENNHHTIELGSSKPFKITPLIQNLTNPDYNILYGFEVTDDRGAKYTFGEESALNAININGCEYVEATNIGHIPCFNGWMLREITYPNGEKISFRYTPITETFDLFAQHVSIMDDGRSELQPGCRYPMGIPENPSSTFLRFLGPEGYQIREGVTEETMQCMSRISLLPSTITTNNCHVSFFYLSNNRLNRITIKDNVQNPIKTVDFTYNANMLLKNIHISDEGNYQFNYYEENNTLIDQSGFDWWGYYNGTTINNNHIPRMNINVRATEAYITKDIIKQVGDGANRQPNENYMKARSLSEIIYPTGGSLNLEYESHKFNVNATNHIGVGLRIKSTQSYDPVSGKRITKNYTYEEDHYTGKRYPDEHSLITTTQLCALDDMPAQLRHRTISVFPTHPAYTNNTPIWYSKVTESTDIGKSIYKYNFQADEYNTTNNSETASTEYLISSINRLLFPSPWLLSEEHYKKEGSTYTMIQSTINSYEKQSSYKEGILAIPYLRNIQRGGSCDFLSIDPCCSPGYKFHHIFGSPIYSYRYDIQMGDHHLVSSQKNSFIGNDTIIERASYEYDTERPYNTIKKHTSNSNQEIITEEYYYSNHNIPDGDKLSAIQQENIRLMDQANYKTTPIQQILKKGNLRLNSKLTGFKKENNSLFVPQTLYFQYGDRFDDRIRYEKYDKYGNPVYVVKDDIEKVVYLWSYKGRYPIAEIKNATYEQVERVALQIGLDLVQLSYSNSPEMNKVNSLRNNLREAIVTTYTYKPLIGISTITNPSGDITYYEYDTCNRLKEVYIYKDYQKEILEAYKYNFVNH